MAAASRWLLEALGRMATAASAGANSTGIGSGGIGGGIGSGSNHLASNLAALLPITIGRPSLLPLYGGGFVPAFLQAAAFYYLVAVLLAWVVPALLPVRGIQPSPPRPGDAWRDAKGSLGPLAVKAAIWAGVERLHASGAAPMLYTGALWPPPAFAGAVGAAAGPSAAASAAATAGAADTTAAAGTTTTAASPPSRRLEGALYAAFCVLALDLLHDAWFYWTHRLLHCRPLYRRVHAGHHQSRAPTPFTGYSFHLLEAALVFANEALVCRVLPLHLGLHRLYHLLTGAVHQAGHAGYEMAPFVPTVAGVAAYAGACALALARRLLAAVAAVAAGAAGLGRRRAFAPPFSSSLEATAGAGATVVEGGCGNDGDSDCKKEREEPAAAGKPSSAAPFFWGGGLWSPPASRAPSAGGDAPARPSAPSRLAAALVALLPPAGLLLLPPSCPLLNTVQHHDLHHRHPRLHFSLYFTHWDRLCGTLHPSYDAGLFRYGQGGGGEAEGEEERGEEQGAAAIAARRRRVAVATKTL